MIANCQWNQLIGTNRKYFLSKLNQRFTDAGFNLPTEAQWEIAARTAGDVTMSLSNADGNRQTVAVQSGVISPGGFYGLTGNVLRVVR